LKNEELYFNNIVNNNHKFKDGFFRLLQNYIRIQRR
jgi:hypothetical protein